jgi:hypothetical protein
MKGVKYRENGRAPRDRLQSGSEGECEYRRRSQTEKKRTKMMGPGGKRRRIRENLLPELQRNAGNM